MDHGTLDALTRSLTDSPPGSTTRRTVTRLLGGLALGGPLALLGLREAEAKCKKKCGVCKRCKKGKCKPKPAGTACAGGTCQGGACLPAAASLPPPSPPTGPGSCALDALFGTTAGGVRRWAQTFLPPRGGKLTDASIFLQANPAAFSLTLQIRPVDAFGVPTNTILGTTTVTNIPETFGFDEPRKITATFSTPAPVTLGQPHALVVNATTLYSILVNESDVCPDGKLFDDPLGTGEFVPFAGGSGELVYSLNVT